MPITIPMSKLNPGPVPELGILPSTFDYAALEKPVADKARAAAKRIHARLDAAKKGIVEIDRDLLAMKEKLPHGEFGGWIAAEFSMTARTAQNYLRKNLSMAKFKWFADLFDKVNPVAFANLIEYYSDADEE